MSESPEIKREPCKRLSAMYVRENREDDDETISQVSSETATLAEDSQHETTYMKKKNAGLTEPPSSDTISGNDNEDEASQSPLTNNEEKNTAQPNDAGDDRLPYGYTAENWGDAFVGYGFNLINHRLNAEEGQTALYQLLHLWRARQAQLDREEHGTVHVAHDFVEQTRRRTEDMMRIASQRGRSVNQQRQPRTIHAAQPKVKDGDETETDVEDDAESKN